MSNILNMVSVVTGTTGTGAITLGAAASAQFVTEVQAGAVDQRPYGFHVQENADFMMVKGTYTAATRQLSIDTVLFSVIGGVFSNSAQMTLASSAVVTFVSEAEDFQEFRDVRSVTGTTDIVVNDDGGGAINYSNAAAIAATIAQAGTSKKFKKGWYVWVKNNGVGTVTFTPTTSTINTATTLPVPAKHGALIYSDGANYHAFVMPQSAAALIGAKNAFTDATASTSPTSGAMTISGGVGVAGDVFVGSSMQVVQTITSGVGSQFGSAISARGSGTQIEWGHSNPAGFGSVLANDTGGGTPYLLFNGQRGTSGNTYKTVGIKGSIIASDLAGGFIFGSIANANADNQGYTVSATLSAAGVFAAVGGGGSASDRQNALLSLAYQSKLYGLAGIGGYRRAINVFADGFTTITGVNAGFSSNYQFDNINGILAPLLSLPGSNVSASGTAIAGPAAAANGSIAFSADGITTGTNGWVSGESSGGVSGVSYVGQHFATARHIRQLVIYQGYNSDASYSCTSAIVQFSDDGSLWNNHSTITLAATLSAQTFALAASGLHLYWRILANSAPGAANRWGVMELQMMENTGASNMSAVTTFQTADAAVSNCRALLEIDNTAAPTLGTDFTIETTCDGGAHYTAASSYTVATSNSQGGRKVFETNDIVCTSGTSFGARIKTLNNKNVPIYALTLTVH